MTQKSDVELASVHNDDSQYLSNYKHSIKNWIEIFIERQRQHVLNAPVLMISPLMPASTDGLPPVERVLKQT